MTNLAQAPIAELFDVAVRIGKNNIHHGVVSVEFASHNYICEVKESDLSLRGYSLRVLRYAPDEMPTQDGE
jgi:hypothetical protein